MLQGLLAFFECCQCIQYCSRDEPVLEQGQLDNQYKEMQTYGGEFTIVHD